MKLALTSTWTLAALLLLSACPPVGDDDDSSVTDDDDATDDDDSGDDDDATPDTTPDGNLYTVLIRGELATDDLDEMQTLHDTIAEGGEGPAAALGDLAHDVYLGVEDDEFLAMDRWDNLPGMDVLYGNPEFQAAFG
ncbi:MAG: hypothetical protein GY898_26140 [Proteobacteria bacterium]|nr:hypothetical protein [Pseudomonadota bacterium]